MTIDWTDRPLADWGSATRRLDLFLQPGLTWVEDADGEGETNAVALLFLESAGPGSDDQNDFTVLAKALTRWFLASAGIDEDATPAEDEDEDDDDETSPAADAVPLSEVLRDAADAVMAAPPPYVDLRAFLVRHFRFEVRMPTEAIPGTVFPFLPDLELRIGTDATDRIRNQDQVGALLGQRDRLAVTFDEDGRPEEHTGTESVFEHLLGGYARLLITRAAQTLIDSVEAMERQAQPRNSLLGLLDEVPYQDIGAMASRFLLYGATVESTGESIGLHRFVGLQFPLDDAWVPTLGRHAIRLDRPARAADLISLGDDGTTLSILLREAELRRSSHLPSATSVDDRDLPPRPRLAHAPTHEWRNRHFGLRSSVAIGTGAGTPSARLFPLPVALVDHLRAPGSTPAIELVRWTQGQPPADGVEAPVLDGEAFRWVTRIDLRVRRVLTADGGEPVADTVEVVGAAEPDKDLLQEIWDRTPSVTISGARLIATGQPGSAVARELARLDDGVLVRSNLSTDTAVDATRFRAVPSEGTDFLQLLWEGLDADTGGFYLAVPDAETVLAETVFQAGPDATLSLVIEHGTSSSHPDETHNGVLLTTLDAVAGGDLVLARSDQTIAVPALPAGHLGFQAVRPHPGNKLRTKPADIGQELSALYHLLGWRVVPSDGFGGRSGPIVGPTADPTHGWRYDRVLPVAELATSGADDDPYRGVHPPTVTSGIGKITLEARWLDLFGNQLRQPTVHDFEVGYFDDLIGINRWPATAQDFEIAGPPISPIANLRFGFDPSPYELASGADAKQRQRRLDRLRADRSTYRAICHQLGQPDVTTHFSTSVTPGVVYPFAPEGLLGFATAVLAQLDAAIEGGGGVGSVDEHTETLPLDVGSIDRSFLFPVTASVTIARRPDRILASLRGSEAHRSIQQVEAALGPRTTEDLAAGATDGAGQHLRTFAERFQEAVPGTRLAVGPTAGAGAGDGTPQPPNAVRLGDGAVRYRIEAENRPVAYAIPPLANSVVSTTVPLFTGDGWPADPGAGPVAGEAWTATRVDNLDLDGLLRRVFVFIEQALDPGLLVPASRHSATAATAIDDLLGHKARLARTLSGLVRPVLEDQADALPSFADPAAAREAIRQQLLIDLVNGYDIETVMQHGVTIDLDPALGAMSWPAGEAPRVRGKVRVVAARAGEDLSAGQSVTLHDTDVTLSPGHLSLLGPTGGSSTFTYLFDTKTPERFEALELELEFVPTDLEYAIKDVDDMPSRQSSDFLSFVLPESQEPAESAEHWTLRQGMGRWPVPIPLRQIPAPPSLIQQEAGIDQSSRIELADVRQWTYRVIYEHPYVSQDTIHGLIELNAAVADVDATASASRGPLSDRASTQLVEALTNLGQLLPRLQADLAPLRAGADAAVTGADGAGKVDAALVALANLVGWLADGLDGWSIRPVTVEATEGDIRLDISEESLAGDEREVTVELLQAPRSELVATVALPDENGPTFGESSIPDRELTIDNLDVLRDQNAWISIWLTRNRDLGGDRADPAFVFHTQAVRFTNLATPFLTNDEPWDIAAETGGGKRPLTDHLAALFDLLTPDAEPPVPAYGARVSCRYAFAMAIGTGLNADLVTAVPILLGMPVGSGGLDRVYAQQLSERIRSWYEEDTNQPTIDGASLRLTVDLFAGAERTGLPVLRISNLSLNLVDIADLGP